MKETIIIGGRTNKTITLKEREFAIAELDKIKAEIRERANECQDYQTYINGLMYTQTYINGLMYTYTIIDKYISELKGENNEEVYN